MKHTPGPWIRDGFPTAIWANGVWVASTNMETVPSEQREANARLIAAAPELLEALKVMLTNNELGEVESQRQGLPRLTEVREKARAAIAKAEGQ